MEDHWKIVYTKDAMKDKKIAFEAGFKDKIEKLLETIKNDPYTTYPPYEKLLGDLLGAYSRRVNLQHRLVYSILNEEHTIKIISLWSHYE